MNRIIIFFMSLVLASCAKEDIPRPEWPEWPTLSAPKIENAVLRGTAGEEVVPAGGTIKFSADISDEGNDLVSYQLLITMDEAEILNISHPLSGRSAKIEEEAVLPFVAGFQTGHLTVTIRVSNALASSTTELTLDDAASVSVVRPETPNKLFLVDNVGHVFEMDKVGGEEFGFRTNTTDLANIGSQFKIAEKLINNEPDYNGLVWGYKDGKISVVQEASEASIPTPSVGTYILENISFDIFSFLRDYTLTLTININAANFYSIGGNYTQFDVNLIENAKINFIGMGSNISNVLRPEFFKTISTTQAKFTGPTALYNLKYNLGNHFLYLERPRDVFYPDVMYIVGTGAGFPRPPYVATLAWDFAYPHQWFFFKKIGDTSFEAILYLDNTMGFKFFRGYGWAQEEDTKNKYTIKSTSIITRNGAGDLVAGSDFQPGVYRIKIDKGTEEITVSPIN